MHAAIFAGGAAAILLQTANRAPVRIGKNYTLADVTRSARAESLGLMGAQRSIPGAYIENARRLATQVLDPIAEQLGTPAGVTSWYRSAAVNEATTGSSDTSKHLTASAADLEFYLNGTERNDLIVRAALAAADFDRMILERGTLSRPAWIHIETAPIGTKPRKIILRFDGTSWQRIEYLAALQLFG